MFATAFLAVPATAQAGFLQIDDIEGEATARGHERWIDVLSVSYAWGLPDGGTTTGQTRRARGRVNVDGLTIVKEMDASTPLLVNALARGTVSQSATIDVMRGNAVVLKYELTNVAITSHAMMDGKEHVSLRFESITISHPASGREAAIDVAAGG